MLHLYDSTSSGNGARSRTLKPWLLMLLALASLLLAACVEIEGGVAPPSTPGTLASETSAPTAPPTTPAEIVTAEPTVTTSGTAFRIGLREEPADLLPYHTDAADARITAPITELLFPAPLLAQSYAYTNTGILERMPSFANGDIELRTVEVFLDAAGAITREPTEVVTEAQQIVITYRWNRDLRWSDGEPVTAGDSVFAYELAQQTFLGDDAERRLLLTERYEQVDPFTTRVFLPPELAAALDTSDAPDLRNAEALLALWTPLPRHVLADVPAADLASGDFALQPLSYGPYVVEERSADTIRLTRNPFYTGEPLPAADMLTFIFEADNAAVLAGLQNGSLDVAVNEQVTAADLPAIEEAAAGGAIVAQYVPSPIWEHLDFNLDFAFLQDIRIRQAIIHGTNRQAMVAALYGEHIDALHSWVLPQHWAYAEPDQLTTYAYDPEQARALLDEMNIIDLNGDGVREQGIDHDSDGEPESSAAITLTLLTTADSPLRADIASRFQADMADIGLAIEVQQLPVSEVFATDGPLFRRQFELAQFAWIANPDPRGFELWACAAVPNEANNWRGSNLPGWCSREANDAIITATTTLDQAMRRDAYIRHQQLFSEELPIIPLFQRLTVVMHSPTLRGVQPDPTAPVTWNIHAWVRE